MQQKFLRQKIVLFGFDFYQEEEFFHRSVNKPTKDQSEDGREQVRKKN